jgi:excinuclease ABC subunit B
VAEESDEYYQGKSALELTKKELGDYIKKMEKEMKEAAANLQFERAAELRDRIMDFKLRL